MLTPSMTEMYDSAVWKLQEPDSHRTPARWQMIPTMESTAWDEISVCLCGDRVVDAIGRPGVLTGTDDDVLQDRPLGRVS